MGSRIAGKVALITGAARGQGRAHALRLAQEGADIIALDICHDIPTIPYPMASAEQLRRTAHEVKAIGRRVFAAQADVRDLKALSDAVETGVGELGRLDIAIANAGVFAVGRASELSVQQWKDIIDINLTGVWHTVKAVIPHMMAAERGGSIILTGSTNGAVGAPMFAHYVAAKHGVVGLVRALAIELEPDGIRVNGLMPAGVATEMVRDFADVMTLSARYVAPDPDRPAGEHPLKDLLLAPDDISDPVVFFASDESRYITGALMPINGKLLRRGDLGLA